MEHPLRKEAKGRDCTVGIPGVCNRDPATTVLAHVNLRSVFMCGMGGKPPDWAGAHSCSACHDVIDGRVTHPDFTYDEIKAMHLEGVIRTLKILIDEGKLPWTI